MRRYRLHLVASGTGVPTINHTLTALRFLFLVTLRKPAIVLDMPFVREPRRLPIVLSPEEVAQGSWLGARKTAFLNAIHAALVEALRTPEDDKILRLIEHPREHFIIPRNADERFTRIEIAMFVGRSLEAKRALYKAIVRHLEPFGVPSQDVKIVLVEVPPQNVGLRGGNAACDIDLGYEISV